MAALVLLAACANDLERERGSRIAARSLVAAPETKVEGELDRMVAFGPYALPDIEQEMHNAPVAGRLRLLRAIERIGSREAVPFLTFLASHDGDKLVRRRAATLARSLR